MTGVNGTLFVSAYGEERVEPDECNVRVTIMSERGTAVEAQKASAKTFDSLNQALSAAKIEKEIETLFFNVEKPKYYDSTKKKYDTKLFPGYPRTHGESKCSVDLKPSSSDHDELVVFLDGKDSRKKALYAPFSEYKSYDTYDKEHLERFY